MPELIFDTAVGGYRIVAALDIDAACNVKRIRLLPGQETKIPSTQLSEARDMAGFISSLLAESMPWATLASIAGRGRGIVARMVQDAEEARAGAAIALREAEAMA